MTTATRERAPVERLVYTVPEAAEALGISTSTMWRRERDPMSIDIADGFRPFRPAPHRLPPKEMMMSEAEWRDGDDPKVRALFGYALRSHVNYQDGRHSEAPALVFADYDYEVGDGVCGLHADGKSANEPTIVYVRADALIDALERAERAEAERDELRALVPTSHQTSTRWTIERDREGEE